MNDADNFADLAAKILAGEASAQERRDFDQILKANLEFQKQFAELSQMHNILRKAGPLLIVPQERLNSLREMVEDAWAAEKERPSFWSWIQIFCFLRPKFAFSVCFALVLVGLFVVISLPRSSTLLISVSDSLIAGIDEKGRLVTHKGVLLPEDLKQELSSKLRNGQLLTELRDPGWAALQRSLAASNEVTLGPQSVITNAVKLEFPVNTAIRPKPFDFRWQEVAGAQNYEISLQKAGDQQVVRQETNTAHLRFSDPIPGATYAWQVTAIKLEGRTIQSIRESFRVLSGDDMKTVAELESKYSESPVVLAAIYQRYGLSEDLKRAQAKILEANPRLGNRSGK